MSEAEQNCALPVLHLFTQYHSLGGVESVLRLHYEGDSNRGIESDLIIYADEPRLSKERLHCLGIVPSNSIAEIGKRVRAVTIARSERLAIYHMPWAFNFFCPNDRARRRILVLHSQPPRMQLFLQRNYRFLDGILCVNKEIRASVLAALPNFPPERIGVVDYPICPPAGSRRDEALGGPIRLGFVGRLQTEQKRVERIPEFCREMERAGIKYDLQLIGEGPERPLVEQQVDPYKVRFRGILRGESYWEALRSLDSIVFFSDYEGTPISMLEAMSQGVIPVYPKINSGGDGYAEQVDPGSLYPAGDLRAAAGVIKKLVESSLGEIQSLRKRSRLAVERHSVANYLSGTFNFCRKIWKLPRISQSNAQLHVRALPFLTVKQCDQLRKLVSLRR